MISVKKFKFEATLCIVLSLAVGCSKDDPANDDKNGLADPETTTSTFTSWESYNPIIAYNFKDDYPNFEMPAKNIDDNITGKAWTVDDRWWTFSAGVNANALVKESDVKIMLNRLNTDFDYIRNVMGWPPDRLPQNGYRSAVYLYGSGMSTDNASNTDLGGWQSNIYLQESGYWPMVLISFYPISCFDPNTTNSDWKYQTDAVVHEGIHTVLTSCPGCKKAGWIQEGGNTWLQAAMEIERNNTPSEDFEFGWLSMGSILAPFMPIECYGGWLLDGSFGGPNTEGLNNNTRNILGGVQYSSVFPSFLEITLGKKSIPWIFQKCTNRVLEGMASGLGEDQLRRLICEYRAKLCLADMDYYTDATLSMYKQYMGKTIKSEITGVTVDSWGATPYVATTEGEDGWLVPDTYTLPGWTGANIVPITVADDAQSVTVAFDPLESTNMFCQLCYRTAEGKTVYGELFKSGACKIDLGANKPAHNVVFMVITNTDYVYRSTATRKARFDYRIKLGTGTEGTADIRQKWFIWT